MRNPKLLAHLLLAIALTGCLEDESFVKNVIPVAHAGDDQDLPFDGEDVEVQLDGSESSDGDGKLVGYIWQSGNDDPVGPDPDDEVMPELTLGKGNWLFHLWVVDNTGAVSPPDSVEIIVGFDPAEQCVAEVNDKAPQACKECMCAMEECREAATACNDTCWDLIGCINDSGCGSDNSCILDMCPDLIGGGSQATALGPCRPPMACVDECSAMAEDTDAGTDDDAGT